MRSSSHQKLEEARNRISLRAFGGSKANTLILDFWPPEPRENKFLLFHGALILAVGTGEVVCLPYGMGFHVRCNQRKSQD